MSTVLPWSARMLMMKLLAAASATFTPAADMAGFNAPYVSSYSYSGKLADCVSGGQLALEKHGFRVDEVKYVDNHKEAFLYTRHTDLALGATIECDPSRGIGSWGVAGPNDEDAFECFKKLSREDWLAKGRIPRRPQVQGLRQSFATGPQGARVLAAISA